MWRSRFRVEFQDGQQHYLLALISPVSQQLEKTQVSLQISLRTRRIVMKFHYPLNARAAGSAEVTRSSLRLSEGSKWGLGHLLVPGLRGCRAANRWHQVWLVRLAQASHPELEKLDVVLLWSSQNAQQLLGILLGSAVHFSEFKEDLHFTAETRNSCHYYSGLASIKQAMSSSCSFSRYLLQLNVNKSFKQYPMETILMLWMKKVVGGEEYKKRGDIS